MANHLAISIHNDLTFNLKTANCYAIYNRLNAPSYVKEKEAQTTQSEEVINDSEIREYIHIVIKVKCCLFLECLKMSCILMLFIQNILSLPRAPQIV